MLPKLGMSVIALGYKPTLTHVSGISTACLCGMVEAANPTLASRKSGIRPAFSGGT
jgi:hypothetical protein